MCFAYESTCRLTRRPCFIRKVLVVVVGDPIPPLTNMALNILSHLSYSDFSPKVLKSLEVAFVALPMVSDLMVSAAKYVSVCPRVVLAQEKAERPRHFAFDAALSQTFSCRTVHGTHAKAPPFLQDVLRDIRLFHVIGGLSRSRRGHCFGHDEVFNSRIHWIVSRSMISCEVHSAYSLPRQYPEPGRLSVQVSYATFYLLASDLQ